MSIEFDDVYKENVNSLFTDITVVSYFKTSKKSILSFIKTYMEVDKILESKLTDTNVLYNKLDEIKNVITHQNSQLLNTQEILKNKLEGIKETTNNELKTVFVDLQKEIYKNNSLGDLKNMFDNFKERIEIINNQRLNDNDRKNLEVFNNIRVSFEKSLDSHQINTKINSIEDSLRSINQNFTNNSSKKGQVAETVLLNILTEAYPDTEVLDTSHNANSGDIQLIREDKPTILIDSKNFGSKTVPKRDLDKFYNDIQQNNCSGILCNAFGGIANKQHFEIDIVDRNILVFVHSHQFDSNVFQLATNIIYNMHKELKEKGVDSIVLDQRLYQNIKIEYNYYIQTFRHHLDIIKSNVNSLSQLSFTLLDNFFKRKAINVELKEFSCPICSAQLSTEKILKTHIKKQHPNIPPPLQITNVQKSRGRPKKMNDQQNDQQNEQQNNQTNVQQNNQTNYRTNLKKTSDSEGDLETGDSEYDKDEF